MRILQTDTEGINVATIKRVAYLSRVERDFLREKTHRPDYGAWNLGEVIADIGRAIPIHLSYVEDALDGSFIVSALVQVISHSETKDEIIDYHEVEAKALQDAADYRRRNPDTEEELDESDLDEGEDGVEGYPGVGE